MRCFTQLNCHEEITRIIFTEIGNKLNIGHSTVQKLWNKFLRTNSTADLPKSGKPCLRSERERRLICRTSKKEVAKILGITNKVTIWTVRKNGSTETIASSETCKH